MPETEPPPNGIDWRLTTWEGSRREQLRRWAALPLERIILAIEEMQELSDQFRQMRETGKFSAPPSAQTLPAESNVHAATPASAPHDSNLPESEADPDKAAADSRGHGPRESR